MMIMIFLLVPRVSPAEKGTTKMQNGGDGVQTPPPVQRDAHHTPSFPPPFRPLPPRENTYQSVKARPLFKILPFILQWRK